MSSSSGACASPENGADSGRKTLRESLDCSLAPISHFETGTRRPSFDNLVRLVNALDVSADYLLGRTDAMEAGR